MTQTSWVFQRCNSRRVISNKKDHKSIVAGSDETPICSKQEAIAKYRRAADRPVSRHSATSYSFSEALSKVFHLPASITGFYGKYHYGITLGNLLSESLPRTILETCHSLSLRWFVISTREIFVCSKSFASQLGGKLM